MGSRVGTVDLKDLHVAVDRHACFMVRQLHLAFDTTPAIPGCSKAKAELIPGGVYRCDIAQNSIDSHVGHELGGSALSTATGLNRGSPGLCCGHAKSQRNAHHYPSTCTDQHLVLNHLIPPYASFERH